MLRNVISAVIKSGYNKEKQKSFAYCRGDDNDIDPVGLWRNICSINSSSIQYIRYL